MRRRTGDFAIVIENAKGVGFHGQVKTLLAWLDGLPKNGTLSAWLGSGLLYGAELPRSDRKQRAGHSPDLPVSRYE